MSPPAGLFVSRVTPASSIAFAFAKEAWPLACSRTTGLFGAAALSDAWVGKPSTAGWGGRSHFSWCQPRPRIHSPGRALPRSEERRVGKECRARWSTYHEKKNRAKRANEERRWWV